LNVDRLWNVPRAMLGIPLTQGQESQHQQLADHLGPLLTMYWNMAEEEDKKMTECWQKDAKPIIIFVRTPHFCFPCSFTYQLTMIDRSVLCRYCTISCRDCPRPQAKPAGNH
jgi:hypothetical protein